MITVTVFPAGNEPTIAVTIAATAAKEGTAAAAMALMIAILALA